MKLRDTYVHTHARMILLANAADPRGDDTALIADRHDNFYFCTNANTIDRMSSNLFGDGNKREQTTKSCDSD